MSHRLAWRTPTKVVPRHVVPA